MPYQPFTTATWMYNPVIYCLDSYWRIPPRVEPVRLNGLELSEQQRKVTLALHTLRPTKENIKHITSHARVTGRPLPDPAKMPTDLDWLAAHEFYYSSYNTVWTRANTIPGFSVAWQ